MGQKINPFGYRLGITENHRSKWFSDSNKAGERYRDFVLEDDKIRKEMSHDLERAGVSRMLLSALVIAYVLIFTPLVQVLLSVVVALKLSAFAQSSRSSQASKYSSTSSK